MTPNQLLKQLEGLTFSGRMARMVQVGREAASNSSVRSTLEALETGDFYSRLMALQACAGSRDGEHILRSLDDPSTKIRGMAIALAPFVCTGEQIGRALEHLAGKLRHNLVKRVFRNFRPEVDALVLRLFE